MFRFHNFKSFVILASLILMTFTAYADVRLPSLFSDHMVLQQKSDVHFRGWAEPGENVRIQGNWLQSNKISAVTDASGEWHLTFQSPDAGGPYDIVINGDNEIVLRDVLFGEVWFASGQSNMAMALKSCDNAEKEIADANFSSIRLFHIDRTFNAEPQTDCNGMWKACTPESIEKFSAAAYYFGREIYSRLNVPIGLISASKGGSPAEAWLSKEDMESDPGLLEIFDMWEKWEEECEKLSASDMEEYEAWQEESKQARKMGTPLPDPPSFHEALDMVKKGHRRPGALYNAMVGPVIPYTIKGVIWYQGENNVSRPIQYRKLFSTLIKSWRKDWRQGDFPFYYVQLPPYGYKQLENIVLLREAQMMAMSLPNTGMVTTNDLGDIKNIHPRNKHDVGKRLALWALANTYGFKNMVYSGPIYKSMKMKKDKIQLYFDHVGSGLIADGDSLTCFSIAGSDKKFMGATALIKGSSVVVYHHAIPEPKAVRFSWGHHDVPNFVNKEGLPAAPFRTDDWDVLNRASEL